MQNERIEHAGNKDKYADNYTTQAASLMDDVLKRPTTWIGIPGEKKHKELTRMQENIDGITKSLIEFADQEQFDYTYDSLGMNIYMFMHSTILINKLDI